MGSVVSAWELVSSLRSIVLSIVGVLCLYLNHRPHHMDKSTPSGKFFSCVYRVLKRSRGGGL